MINIYGMSMMYAVHNQKKSHKLSNFRVWIEWLHEIILNSFEHDLIWIISFIEIPLQYSSKIWWLEKPLSSVCLKKVFKKKLNQFCMSFLYDFNRCSVSTFLKLIYVYSLWHCFPCLLCSIIYYKLKNWKEIIME